MHALTLLKDLANLAFVVMFLAAAVQFVRERTATNRDILALFGAAAFLSVTALLIGRDFTSTSSSGLLRTVIGLALPLLFVRVYEHFAHLGRVTRIALYAALPAAIVLAFLGRGIVIGTAVVLAYFLAALGYPVVGFARLARAYAGITRTRMLAVCSAVVALVVTALSAAMAARDGNSGLFWDGMAAGGSVACAGSCMLAFTPPGVVLRLWEAAALRRLLEVIAMLPASAPLPDSLAVLNRAIARELGAANAMVMMWDEAEQRLLLPGVPALPGSEIRLDSLIAAEVFRTGGARYVENASAIDPTNATVYERFHAQCSLAASIVFDERKYGVLSAFDEHDGFLWASQLPLIEAIARQVGAFLRRHELVREAIALEAGAQTVRLREEFLNAAAHDLRTPLTSLRARLQLAARRARRDGIELDFVDGALADVGRLEHISGSLLDVARLERGVLVPQRAPLDLRHLAEEAVAAREWDGRTVRIEGDRLTVSADGELIRRVLENLLDNAVKFSTPETEVIIRLSGDGGRAWFEVEDRGMGIESAEMDRIFGRFERGSAASARGAGGFGLGLYLARQIVEAHGGTISVRPGPDGGSVFHVDLLTDESGEARALPAMPGETIVESVLSFGAQPT